MATESATIVQRLWNYCNVLRDDGVSYGDYVEQFTVMGLPSAILAEWLRQSILKRAFEGRLVPQDPEDEPASALLERIQAEKAQREAAKKSKKTGQKKRRARQLKLI